MFFKIKIFIIISLIFIYEGCDLDSEYNPNKLNIEKRSTSIIFDVSTIAIKKNLVSENNVSQKSLSNFYEGEILIKNLDTNEDKIIPWYANLNNETFKFESNRQISLEPGNYKITFLLKKEDTQRYIGTDTIIIIDNQISTLDFTLSPVLGNLNINIKDIENINQFFFKYQNSDFLNLENPILNFILDDSEEISLKIDSNNSDINIPVNIENGLHHISLKLFDGNKQIGKSSKDINITENINIIMNIEPLKGDLSFNLNPIDGVNI